MANDGIELTREELERALQLRPKVPLTAEQQDALLEMLEWWQTKQEQVEVARMRREAWQKRYPIIFGATSALVALVSLAYNIFRR